MITHIWGYHDSNSTKTVAYVLVSDVATFFVAPNNLLPSPEEDVASSGDDNICAEYAC